MYVKEIRTNEETISLGTGQASSLKPVWTTIWDFYQ